MAWSMGLMMKGIAASPVASMTHLRVWAGSDVDRWRSRPVAQQILLIVKPGTATDATPCHTRVSTTDDVTILVFSESHDHGICREITGQSNRVQSLIQIWIFAHVSRTNTFFCGNIVYNYVYIALEEGGQT